MFGLFFVKSIFLLSNLVSLFSRPTITANTYVYAHGALIFRFGQVDVSQAVRLKVCRVNLVQ